MQIYINQTRRIAMQSDNMYQIQREEGAEQDQQDQPFSANILISGIKKQTKTAQNQTRFQ